MEPNESNSVQPIRLLIRGVDVNGKGCQQIVTAYDLNYSGARLEGLIHAIAPGTTVDLRYNDVVVAARVVWLAVCGSSQRCRAGVRLVNPKKCPWAAALPNPEKVLRFPERRKANRYRMPVRIEMLDEDGNLMMQTITSDVGIGGCYVETDAPPEVGTCMRALLRLGSEKIQATAVVRATYPGIGMGIEFLDLSWEQTERLYQYLELSLSLS